MMFCDLKRMDKTERSGDDAPVVLNINLKGCHQVCVACCPKGSFRPNLVRFGQDRLCKKLRSFHPLPWMSIRKATIRHAASKE